MAKNPEIERAGYNPDDEEFGKSWDSEDSLFSSSQEEEGQGKEKKGRKKREKKPKKDSLEEWKDVVEQVSKTMTRLSELLEELSKVEDERRREEIGDEILEIMRRSGDLWEEIVKLLPEELTRGLSFLQRERGGIEFLDINPPLPPTDDQEWQKYNEDLTKWFRNLLPFLWTTKVEYQMEVFAKIKISLLSISLKYPHAANIARNLNRELDYFMNLIFINSIRASGNLEAYQNALSQLQVEFLETFFGIESLNPEKGELENPVAHAFLVYEEMACTLEEMRNDPAKKDEASKQEAEIINLHLKGGRISDFYRERLKNFFEGGVPLPGNIELSQVEYYEDALRLLEKVDPTSLTDDLFEEIGKLKDMARYNLWKYRIGGDVWGIMGNDAFYKVAGYGTMSFITSRLFHPSDFMAADNLLEPTRSGWENLDLRLQTPFMALIQKVINKAEDTEKLLKDLEAFGIKLETRTIRTKDGEKKIVKKLDLREANLSDPRLWLFISANVPLATNLSDLSYTAYIQGEATRKVLCDPQGGVFAKLPQLEAGKTDELIENLGNVFSYLGGEKEVRYIHGKEVEVSGRQSMIEDMVRRIAKVIDERHTKLSLMPAASLYEIINKLREKNLLTEEQADLLMEELIINKGLPLPLFGSIQRRAFRKALNSIDFFPIRVPGYRSFLLFGLLYHLLKLLVFEPLENALSEK